MNAATVSFQEVTFIVKKNATGGLAVHEIRTRSFIQNLKHSLGTQLAVDFIYSRPARLLVYITTNDLCPDSI